MTSSSYDNGVSESRTYNNDNTVASISFTGAAIGNLGYTWDANLNKTSETIGGVMSGYGFTAGYDDEDRLVSWDRSDNTLDQAWNLSPVGDWNSITQNSTVQNRTHGPVHELLTAAGESLTYDAKGNMTLIPLSLRSGSDPLTVTWDFNNKLRGADTDDDGIEDVFYIWDALGRRVGRTANSATTIYFQDGQQTLADYASGASASSPTYIYLFASYIDEVVLRSGSSGSVHYHRNQQYSIYAVTDNSGNISERYAYTAYGELTITASSGTPRTSSAVNNRHTYTGREWDETLSLYHYRARMYDSLAVRFCSRDPIEYAFGQNLYTYVSSSPCRSGDPYGLFEMVGPSMNPGAPSFESATEACTIESCLKGCNYTTACVMDCKQKLDQFRTWYSDNTSLFWTLNLPACPCKLPVEDGCVKPDPRVWGSASYGYLLLGYHVGAASCIRSVPVDGHASQCCYDALGDVITSGSGSGSADFGAAGPLGSSVHTSQDVEPANWAWTLDGNKWGCFSEAYLLVRPNFVSHCKDNPTK